MVVIKLIQLAAGFQSEAAGMYLKSFTPEVGYRAQGELVATPHIGEAKRFSDIIEATEFWKQQSKTVPFRGDGKPNRPLTAWTITFFNVEE